MPSNFTEWEKGYIQKTVSPERDVIKCPKCSCSWFEKVVAAQYLAMHHVILGQPPPEHPAQVPYVLLRCVKCKELVEPKLMRNTTDSANKKYDEFLDTLDSPLPQQVKTENI